MKDILFVSTIFRCGEKVYPIIEPLSKIYRVEVLYFNQMSPKTPWEGDVDVRRQFYSMCQKNCSNAHTGASHNSVMKNHGDYLSMMGGFKSKKYDLIIVDDNLRKSHYGTSDIYRWAKRYDKKVIGCPHGNREFDKTYDLCSSVGKMFDFSFVFGKKEQLALGRKRRNLLIPGGIPSNDKLVNYKRKKEYVLVIPNYESQEQSAGTKYSYFSRDTFLSSGVISLAKNLNLPILVKEKSRFPKRKQSNALKKSLSNLRNINFVMDVEDDNDLISKAAVVVSAPSTLAFKPIQMGIPTVVLNGYGMIGNFFDYRGLVQCDAAAVNGSIEQQISLGRDLEFISNTLEGGTDFNSTDIYIEKITEVLYEKV